MPQSQLSDQDLRERVLGELEQMIAGKKVGTVLDSIMAHIAVAHPRSVADASTGESVAP